MFYIISFFGYIIPHNMISIVYNDYIDNVPGASKKLITTSIHRSVNQFIVKTYILFNDEK